MFVAVAVTGCGVWANTQVSRADMSVNQSSRTRTSLPPSPPSYFSSLFSVSGRFNVRLTKRLRALSAGSRSEKPRPALNRAESVPGKPLLLRLVGTLNAPLDENDTNDWTGLHFRSR